MLASSNATIVSSDATMVSSDAIMTSSDATRQEGVEIAETPISQEHAEGDQEGLTPGSNSALSSEENPSLGLGDRIQIESKTLGRVVGRIYYLDEDLLRILPDGVSNRLYDFPITAEGIDPEIGVTEILTEPTKIASFVEQNRLRVGAKIDTFTSEGDSRNSYSVDAVDPDADSIIIVDESGDKQEVVFNYTGIPRDLPFEVIRVAPEGEVGAAEGSPEGAEGEAADATAPTEEEEEDQILGEIEIPIFAEVSDIPAAQRIYPESVQKNDLFVDLLTLLDVPSQKNPTILRQIRAVVEIANSLVKQVVQYAADGTPIGGKPTSVNQLLELLSGGKVPLARPVLNTVRTLYLEHSEDYFERLDQGLPTSEAPFKNENFDVNYILDDIIATQQAVAVATAGASDEGLSRLYTEQNIVIDNLQRPWKESGASGSGSRAFTARTDTDFFRAAAPSDDSEVPGLRPTLDKNQAINYTPERLDEKISFSLLKAVSGTYRKTKTGKLVLATSSDKASLISYLLFPIIVADLIGSTRTYKLSRDIGRSSMQKKWMSEILDQIGNVSEIPGAGTILNIGAEGNTLGNINVADYLVEIIKLLGTTRFLGLDDFRTLLIDLGLDNYELNQETTDILQHRVLEDIARVRSLIKNLREKLASIDNEGEPAITSFLDDESSKIFRNTLGSVSLLANDIKELGKRTPSLATNDIAILAFLLATKQDLTIAALGKQIQLVERERIRVDADIYLATQRAAITVKQRKEQAKLVAPPVPNKCAHVSTLTSIRKIKNDSERITLLAKFVSRFQGDRDANYVDCIVCNEHLICIHEILQIQQALRPREQEVLQKELYLNMAGGVFNGRYICRNCGQAIAELQFDSQVEFNDSGAAINGRSLLVDPDEVAEEQLGLQLGVSIPGTEDIVFDNEAKTLCYNIAKEIYQRVGVYPDYSDYKNVVESAFMRIQTLDSRDDYDRKRKAATAKGAKNIPDYDTYIKGFTVTSVAALILIDVQTHIPDYVVRYTLPGCEAGFGGFPLQDGDKRTGVNYISCAVGSITRNEEPWNRTGFLQIRSDEARRNTIAKFMETILTKILNTEPTVQQKIAAKLEYLRETFGAEAAEGRPRDKIPFGFLPVQEHVKADTDAQVVVPEATGKGDSVGQRKLAAVWIREGHKHALRTAQLVRGNPFAETACCFGPIGRPGAYWSEQKSIILSGRAQPVSPLFRSSVVFIHFTPKPIAASLVEAPMNLAFRIFLKVCYAGPRLGYAHELGYNGVCDNCGLRLSTKYLFPDYTLQTSRKASVPIINTQELISDLQAQGVNVTPEFFQEILDASHRNYIVPPVTVKEPPPTSKLLSRLGDLDPAPIENWRPILADLITKLTTLPKDANETDIALAYGAISEVTSEAEQFIKRRFNSQQIAAQIDKWLQNDAKQLFEIFLAYLITPLQRLLTRYETKTLRVSKLYDLGSQHAIDLNEMLEKHTDTSSKYATSFENGLAAVKIRYFLEQIQGLAKFAQEIQAARVPGGEIGTKYLKRALAVGPLAELLDFNRVPLVATGEVAAESLVDRSGSALVAFLTACMGQFTRESLSYSPDEIRLRIAKAKEKEKMNIVSDLDKLDDDAKRVELVNKALGLGRWAIGGSKLIYAYDADQYERERDERIKRGGTDLPMAAESMEAPGNNQVFDIFGQGVGGGDQFYEGEGGYDVGQEADDDF